MSFKDELKSIVKSPQEIQNERKREDIEGAKYIASEHYKGLKDLILETAKDQGYEFENGKKVIKVDYELPLWSYNSILTQTCFRFDPNPYSTSEVGVRYNIADKEIFDTYIHSIKGFAMKDEISISLCGKYYDNGSEHYFQIPGGIERIGKHTSMRIVLLDVKIVLRGKILLD